MLPDYTPPIPFVLAFFLAIIADYVYCIYQIHHKELANFNNVIYKYTDKAIGGDNGDLVANWLMVAFVTTVLTMISLFYRMDTITTLALSVILFCLGVSAVAIVLDSSSKIEKTLSNDITTVNVDKKDIDLTIWIGSSFTLVLITINLIYSLDAYMKTRKSSCKK